MPIFSPEELDGLVQSDYEPIGYRFAKSKPKSAEVDNSLEWGDHGRAFMMGGGGVVEGIGYTAKKLGFEDSGQFIQDLGSRAVEYWAEGLSPQAKAEMAKQFIREGDDGYELGDAGWNTVKLSLAQSALGTAAGMGLGGIFTKGLQLVPKLPATIAGMIGYGSGEAAIASGQSGATVEKQVDAMSHDELMQHPEYQAAFSLTENEQTAKRMVRDAAAGDAAALTGISTFLLSAPFGAVMGKFTAGIPLNTTRARSIATGAGGEAGQEFFQSGAEALSQNYAMQQHANPNQDLSHDVLNSAIGGAASGGIMGGALGVASPLEMKQTNPIDDIQKAQEEARANGGDSLDQATAGAGGLLSAVKAWHPMDRTNPQFTPPQFEPVQPVQNNPLAIVPNEINATHQAESRNTMPELPPLEGELLEKDPQLGIDRLRLDRPFIDGQQGDPELGGPDNWIGKEDKPLITRRNDRERLALPPPMEKAKVAKLDNESTDSGESFDPKRKQARVKLEELTLSEDVPQFKSGASKDGVVEQLRGEYDEVGMAPIQVWVRKNGKKEILTGRHRFDLAKRSNQKDIPAQLHYEADGFTADHGKALDAILNIRDNQGSVKDYVEFIRSSGITEQESEKLGITSRQLGRRAYTIAKEGSDSLVTALRNDQITEAAAEAITRVAPKDEAYQAIGLKAIQDGKTQAVAVNMIRAAKTLKSKPDMTQEGDLFGFDDSAMKQAEAMAKAASSKQRQIKERVAAVKGAAKNPKLAKQEGVDVKNPESLKKRIAELTAEAERYEEWHKHPDLLREIQSEVSGQDFQLETQTEESLAQQEAETTKANQAEAEAKAQEEARIDADKEVDSFTLSGSDSAADIAMANGQTDIFADTQDSSAESKGQQEDNSSLPFEKEASNEESKPKEPKVKPKPKPKPKSEKAYDPENSKISALIRANVEGSSKKKIAHDVAEITIKHGRRLTDSEISDLAAKHGTEERIIKEITNSPVGYDYIMMMSEIGNKHAIEFREAHRIRRAEGQKSENDQAKKPKPKPKASDNKIFTEDAAEKARALLKKKLGQLNSGLDPEIMQAGITLAGYHIEKGARTFAAYAKAMVADLGDSVKPYLKSWYMGIKYDPRATNFDGMSAASEVESADIETTLKEGSLNAEHPAGNQKPDSAGSEKQSSEGNLSDEGRGSSRPGANEDGAAASKTQSGPSESVGVSGSTTTGKSSNKPLHNAKPKLEDGITGSSDDIGSLPDSTGGLFAEQESGEAIVRVIEATTAEQSGVKRKLVRRKDIEEANADQIKERMPFLTDGQVEDVVKAEQRFAKPDGYGMMFTNGTGTGKTFTGMGVVRRMVDKGKKNILIVAPKQTIADAWKKAANSFFDLKVESLKDTKDKGQGIVVTTYANLGQNNALVEREWDLVVADEAHYLSSDQQGSVTMALRNFRALTLKSNSARDRVYSLNSELVEEARSLKSHYEASRGSDDERVRADGIRAQEAASKIYDDLKQKTEAEKKRLESVHPQDKPRALFLSATPFAYDKNIVIGQEFLFDWGSDKDGAGSLAYNSGDNFQHFMMTHFGYRMRYNKLTSPDAKVDSSLMERAFNSWLKKEGVLSGRALDSDFDYDRRFILAESVIGRRVDDAIAWLRGEGLQDEPDDHRDARNNLSNEILEGKFKYHARMYFLEAIKAREAIPYIQEYIDSGRKVLVMHDYKKGGTTNPFRIIPTPDVAGVYSEFKAEFADLIESFGALPSPIELLGKHFKGALIYNGDVSAKNRISLQNQFNSDEPGSPQLMIAQGDAMREGVSIHDTSGKNQRVLIHLGMPVKPTAAIQQEGRIYRTGQASDAIFRYLTIGSNWERTAFASTISQRASTAENLAMGEQARGLKESFIEAYEEADTWPVGMAEEGKGGKERDRALANILTPWDMAKSYYFGTKKQGSGRSSKGREGSDYFATPEPLGLKMVQWADIRGGESVLEPSGGHGAIGRWFPENTTNRAIEQSSELSSKLSLRFPGEVLTGNFEDHNIINKYDAIIMNPPYGSGGKLAADHVRKAIKHLRDGGRVVALIPTGPAADKQFDRLLYPEKDAKDNDVKDIHVVASIAMPRVTFERVGTTVATRVLVLEKQTNKALAEKIQQTNRDYSGAETIAEFFDRLESSEIKPRVKPEEVEEVAESATTTEGAVFHKMDSVHSKKGHDLFVVNLEGEMGDNYDRYSKAAKDNGGFYIRAKLRSFYKPKNNAKVPGNPSFSFESSEDRDAFIAEVSETVGDSPRFSLNPKINSGDNKGKPPTVSMEEVDSVIDSITDTWASKKNNIRVRDKFEDLPAQIKKSVSILGIDKAKVKGAYYEADGNIYIVRENLESAADVEKTLFHEGYGHFAMRQLMGKDLHREFRRLFLAIGGHRGFNAMAKKHGIDLKEYEDLHDKREKFSGKKLADEKIEMMMDELFAHIAESNKPGIKRAFKELIGKIRDWLRQHGFIRMSDVSESELYYLLAEARRAVEGKQTVYYESDRYEVLFTLDKEKGIGRHKIAKLFSAIAQNAKNWKIKARLNKSKDVGVLFNEAYDGDAEITKTADKGQEILGSEYLFTMNVEGERGEVKIKFYSHGGNKRYIVIDSDQEGSATAAYQAAFAWAHNNDFVLIPDPSTITTINYQRRLEAAISSALRFGTTKHIRIDKNNLVGLLSEDHYNLVDGYSPNHDIPDEMFFGENTELDRADEALDALIDKWSTENSQAAYYNNLDMMLRASSALAFRRVPELKNYEYSEEKAAFVRKSEPTKALDDVHIPVSFGKGVGRTTAKRALLVGQSLRGRGGLGWMASKGDRLSLDEAAALEAIITGETEFGNEGDFLSDQGVDTLKNSDATTEILYSIAGGRTDEALNKFGLGMKKKAKLSEAINKVVAAENEKSFWSMFKHRAYEGMFDGLIGIDRAEKAVGVSGAKNSGYIGARLATGVADVMHAILHYGAPKWKDGVLQYKEGTQGLLDILGKAGKDLHNYLAWVGAHRAEELMAQGKENNLTIDDIKELKGMAKGKEALFKEIHTEYKKLSSAMLDMAEESGLITADARAKYNSDWYIPFYRNIEDEAGNISLLAPRTSKGLSHQTAGIKQLKGGEQATNDLLENILANWMKLADSSMKNSALVKTVNNLKDTEYLEDHSLKYTKAIIPKSEIRKRIRADRAVAKQLAEEVGIDPNQTGLVHEVLKALDRMDPESYEQLWAVTAPTAPDVIQVKIDGKNKYYKVKDPALLRAITHLSHPGFHDPVTKVGRYMKRLLTTGITSSPDFILRNFIRDAAHAWAINPDGFKLGVDSIKGLKDALREDPDYRELMFTGASFQGGYVHGTDPEASAQIIRRALEKKGLSPHALHAYESSLLDTPAKGFDALKQGWQKYRELGDKVENANRLATYKAAKKSGKSILQAAFESKDLMDYSLRGNFAMMQYMVDLVPFMNARLQGMSKLVRAAHENPKRVLVEAGFKLALFSFALAMLNDDDERYQELPDWDKDANWHFWLGDDHYRLPKPFEIGIVFGTIPERLTHTLTGTQDAEKLLWSIKHNLWETMAINPTPQFAMPIIENVANRKFFFDQPIEGMSDEGKIESARYNENTSMTMRVLGEWTGYSPKKLEHLLNGYLGTMGMYALGIADMFADHATGRADKPDWKLEDLPVIKALYRGDTNKSTQYTTDVFDRWSEIDQVFRTINSFKKEGRTEEAEELRADNLEKLRYRRQLGKARNQLGDIRKQMDQLSRNRIITAEAKREKMDGLIEKRNAIAKKYAELTDEVF